MPTGRSKGLRGLMLAAAVLGTGFAAGWAMRGGAEAQEDPSALAESQLGRFYEALAGRGSLADVLGDAFQIIRTDGTRYDRDAYLARPPSYSGYTLGDIKALQSGDVLTATYFAGVTGTIEGTGLDSQDQPRMAVFTRTGGAWQLQALANLGMGLIADPEAAGKAAVEAWVGAVADGDKEALARILAPEFQIIRSDGTAYDTASYLQSELPRFPEAPAFASLVVTGYGDYLVARYEITSKVMLGSEEELRYGPRLTVFRKGGGGTWLVVSHANLASITR